MFERTIAFCCAFSKEVGLHKAQVHDQVTAKFDHVSRSNKSGAQMIRGKHLTQAMPKNISTRRDCYVRLFQLRCPSIEASYALHHMC